MKTYRITVNGNQYDVTVEEISGQAPAAQNVAVSVPAAKAPDKAAITKPTGGAGAVKIDSPLPGSIFKILVKTGEKVKKGQVIIVIEAMKMENEVLSPSDGTIVSVEVSEGSSVNTGDLLLTMGDL